MCSCFHFPLCQRTAQIYDQDFCTLFTQTSRRSDEPKSTFFYTYVRWNYYLPKDKNDQSSLHP